MQEEKYQLVAKRNLSFKPIKYRIDGKNHFQIFLSIKSANFDPKLEKVAFVQYELHKSFKDRIRVSKNPNNNFEIEIKTWGTFIVKVSIQLKNGDSISFSTDYSKVLESVEL